MAVFKIQSAIIDNNQKYNAENQAILLPDVDPPSQSEESTEQEAEESLDSFIDNGDFQTPSEFYNGNNSFESLDNSNASGYDNVEPTKGNDDAIYFWVEDLKNWCCYDVSTIVMQEAPEESLVNHKSRISAIVFRLKIWNGRDGWIYINNGADQSDDINLYDINFYDTKNMINVKQDIYNIAPYQKPFIHKLNGSRAGEVDNEVRRYYIGMQRSRMDIMSNFKTSFVDREEGAKEYSTTIPYTIVNGFRLQKEIKYSINDKNFQTRRINTVASSMGKMSLYTDYMGTDVRDFISTGAPCVWRMSTGEIFLATKLLLSSDVGASYYYKKVDANADIPGAQPYYILKKLVHIPSITEVLSSVIQSYEQYRKATNDYRFGFASEIRANRNIASFVNELCRTTFGSGDEKTIENDWLREYKITKETVAESDYNNMLDSKLIFEQVNNNVTNTMKCSFKVNRPTVTTNDADTVDYVKKW